MISKKTSYLPAYVVGIVVWVWCGSLFAQADSVRLQLEKSKQLESCPDAEKLKIGIAAKLGFDPFDSKATNLFTIRIELASNHPGYTGEVFYKTPNAPSRRLRRLETDKNNCKLLTDALALTIATAIDPTASIPSIQNDKRSINRDAIVESARYRRLFAESNAKSSVLRQILSKRSKTTSDESVKEKDMEWNLVTGAGGSVGATPSVSFFPLFGIDWQMGRFSIRLEGRFELPTTEPVPGGGSYETSLITGDLALCRLYEPFFGCGVLEAGSLQQGGSGLRQNRTRRHLHVSTGARIGGDWSITEAFGLRFRGQLLASITATRTTVTSAAPDQNKRILWETPPFSGQIGILGVWTF